MTPRMLELTDLPLYVDHLYRAWNQSGRGTVPIFITMANSEYPSKIRVFEDQAESWGRPVGTPGWGRAWGVFSDDGGALVGSTRFVSGKKQAETHRANMGIMIEDTHRARGLGRALLSHSMSWAREQPRLEWIDAETYAHNAAARGLFKSLGFQELAIREDRFRISGASVDEVLLVSRLR
jgi:RimJ/RimL family protein N-acetyltransferase